LSEATKKQLREVLVPEGAFANPVDLTADGAAPSLERAIEIAIDDEMIDAVIVVVTDVVALKSGDARAAIARVARRSDKPVVACLLGSGTPVASDVASLFGEVPSPERAAAALNHVCRYAQWRRHVRPVGEDVARLPANAVIRDIVATNWRRTKRAAGSNSRRRLGCSRPAACRYWRLAPPTARTTPRRSPARSGTPSC